MNDKSFNKIKAGLEDAIAGNYEIKTKDELKFADEVYETVKPKAKRGFAVMSVEQRRAIAAKGGASVKDENRAFSRNSELARAAGAKGGSNSHGGGRPKKVTEE